MIWHSRMGLFRPCLQPFLAVGATMDVRHRLRTDQALSLGVTTLRLIVIPNLHHFMRLVKPKWLESFICRGGWKFSQNDNCAPVLRLEAASRCCP